MMPVIWVLTGLIVLESVAYARRCDGFKDWRTFDWVGAGQHLLALQGAIWMIMHFHDVNTGHLLVMLALVMSMCRRWVFRLFRMDVRADR